MMSPARLHEVLAQHPFPGAVVDDQTFILTVDGFDLYYLGCEWRAGDRTIPATWPAFDSPDDGDRVHAEIRRVLAIVNAPADDPLYDRATAAQALAKVTAERDALIVAESTLSKIAAALAIPALEPHDNALSMVKRLVDGHTVVSQRLVGLQKEIATLTAQHNDWQADIDRAHRQRDEATARAVKVEARLRRDDELRSQIAVAVGLDGSASLALILDSVTRDRPRREISRLSGLLDVLAAPVAFGERRLSTTERAEWALRRWLTEGKECDARIAQLIEAEVYLDVLGVPAYAAVPSDDPGDASEALTLPERLRLHFGAKS